MLIILIILFIILIIDFVVVTIVFSNIVLEISDCEISYNDNYIEGLLIKRFKLNVYIYIFKIVKILKIEILKNSIEVLGFKININIEDRIKNKKNLYSSIINKIKEIRKNKNIINTENLKPIISNLNLNISFGTQNPILTTFSIPTISFVISLILGNFIYRFKDEKYTYTIAPKYTNTNSLNIVLDTKLTFSTLKLLIFLWQYKKCQKLKIEI